MAIVNHILEKKFLFTCQKKSFIFFLLIFEYFSILVQSFDCVYKVANQTPASENKNNFLYYLNYLNIVFLFRSMRLSITIGGKTIEYFSPLLILVFTSTIVAFYIGFNLFIFLEIRGYKGSTFQKITKKLGINILNSFFTNFSEIIVYIFSIVIFYIGLNSFFSGLSMMIYNNDVNYMFLSLYPFLISLIYSYVYLCEVRSLNIIVHFCSSLTYHNDNIFSKKFKYLLMWLKIGLALEDTLPNLPFDMSNLRYFLNILIMMAIVMAFLFVLYILVVKSSTIFLINEYYNFCRIFHLTVNSLILIYLIIFNLELELNVLTIIILFSCLCCSFSITMLISEKNKKNICRETNFIYQLIYIFNKKQFLNENELDFTLLDNEIVNLTVLHKFSCRLKQHYMIDKCLICETEDYDYHKFLVTYTKMIKKVILTDKYYFCEYDIDCYTLIKLFILEQREKEAFIKIIIKYKHLWRKHEKAQICFFWNLTLFFNILYSNQQNFITTQNYKILKTIDITCGHIQKSLRSLLAFIGESEGKSFERDIYQISSFLFEKRSKIYKNIAEMKKLRLSTAENINYTETFQTTIKFIYEVLYNSKSSADSYMQESISDYEDLLNFNFKNDKFIHLLFEIDKDSLTIQRASKDFIHKVGDYFEEIISSQFKFISRGSFKEQLSGNKKNSFVFQFLTPSVKDDGKVYPSNMRMDCKIYPSFNFDEVILVCNFQLDKHDIIIFEIGSNPFNFQEQKKIVNFSYNISKIFGLTEERLSLSKRGMLCNDIFKIKSKGEAEFFYEFTYDRYLQFYKNHLSKSVEHDIEDALKFSSLVETNRLSLGDNLTFKLEKLYEINKNGKVFEVHWIQGVKNKNERITLDAEENTEYDFNDFFHAQDSGTNISSSTNRSTSFTPKKEENKEHLEFKKNSNSLKKFVKISLIYNFCIVSFCGIFIVLGLIDSQKINSAYDFYNAYNNVERTFFHTLTNLLNNFIINYPGLVNPQVTYYNEHFKINPDIKINLRDYINKEAGYKLDLFLSRIVDYEKLLADNAATQSDIANTSLKMYSLSVVGSNIAVLEQETGFIEALRILINKMKIILDNQERTIPVKIINFRSDYIDFSNIDTNNLNPNEIICYEILINYINIVRTFNNLKSILRTFNTKIVNSAFSQTFYLTFILLGLHIFLIIIYFSIVSSFYKVANYDIKMINNLFTPLNIKNLRSKLEALSKLNKFYIESPSKIIHKLKRVKPKINSRDLSRENSVIASSDHRKIENNAGSKFSVDVYKLISSMMKSMIILFTIYFLYSLLFYDFIDSNGKTLLSDTQIYWKIIDNDNRYFDQLNIFQVMMNTNNTDEDMYKMLNLTIDENEGYLMKRSSSSLTFMRTMESWENSSSGLKTITTTEQQLMNCNFIYTKTNDVIFQETLSRYFPNQQGQMILELEAVCNTFDFMNRNNSESVLQENYVYILQKMLMKYKYSDRSYLSTYFLYNNSEFVYLSILCIFILRPITFYLTVEVIYSLIIAQLEFYLGLIIVYLVLNVAFDTFILLFIKFQLIDRIMRINNEFSNFVDILKTN